MEVRGIGAPDSELEIQARISQHQLGGETAFYTGDRYRRPLFGMLGTSVLTTDRPRVDPARRVSIEPISEDFKKLVISYGFMEQPNVPKALGVCRKQGLKFDIMSTSFFLGRRSVVASATEGMPLWQDRLFIFLMRNAANPTDFFHIPPGRVVELGAQVSV